MGQSTPTTALPYRRALTVEDLADLPDDGHRDELIDGSLLVTPAPHGHAAGAPDRGATHRLLVVDRPFPLRLQPSGLVR